MTTAEPLLEVDGLGKRFGGFTALSDISLTAQAGERLGIIGPNGSGKTTLINCIAGALPADAGRIRYAGSDITRLAAHRRSRLGIARTFQIPRPFGSFRVGEAVALAAEFAGSDVADAQCGLHRLGLGDKIEALATGLTQIDLRRLELARALATRPKLLIVDEVMAGLTTTEVDQLLDILLELNAEGMTVLMIEHIMRAIMRFSSRVLCLDAGRTIAMGAPEEVAAHPKVREVYLGA